MRKTGKVLGAVLAAVMILTSFSFVVMADKTVKASGEKNDYYWTYYSDGELYIKCKFRFCYLSCVETNYLDNATKVTFDVSDIDYNDQIIYFDGDECAAKSVKVTGCEGGKLYSLQLTDFPSVTANNVELPKNTDIGSLILDNIGLTTIDFLSNATMQTLDVYKCSNLTDIKLSDKIVGLNIFNNPKLKKITTTSALASFGVEGCPNLTDINLPSSMERLVWFDCTLTEYTVGKDAYVRLQGENLKKISFEPGRDKITMNMFSGCTSLSEVNIPNGLTTIEYRAFRGCSSLKSVFLPNSITSIGKEAFSGTGLESVKLPSGVTSLTNSQFSYCKSLKSVTIPVSLTSLGYSVFSSCNISDVYYEGTVEQWKKINAGYNRTAYDNFPDATIHFNCVTTAGWAKSGGVWRYFDNDGNPVTGWQSIGGTWYLFDDYGAMQTGWKKYNGSWYYLDPGTGAMATGWKQVNGKWYFFDRNSGAMCSNEVFEDNGKVYIITSTGELATNGWYKFGSCWYYINSDGTAATGWKKIDGKWYYFFETGSMVTSCWIKDNGKWYFFDANGNMVTGWKQDGETWYFLKSNGEMAANEYCNGYWFNADGTWTYKYVAKWTKDSTGWWYGDSTGWYAKNQSIKIDGKVYNFNASGYCTNP